MEPAVGAYRAFPSNEHDRRIATVFARVEHVFESIMQMDGKLRLTFGKARTDFAGSMMAVCCKLERLTYRNPSGVLAQ